MGNWFNRWAFTKKLWFRLAVSFTILTFCAMTLLIVILYGFDDYKDFDTTLTLDNIEKQVASEKLAVAQVILDAESVAWWDKVRSSIRDKLINLESGRPNTIYRITSSSRPEVYIQIANKNGSLLMSDPAEFPEKIASQFAAQKELPEKENSILWVHEKGPIWVDMAITDSSNRAIGRLRILYFADFNLWVQLKSLLDFLLFVWGFVFCFSLPIGIACGLLASQYVTSQLQKMNEVTESWRQGKFDARIELPSDNVLVRHSQHLNDMAQDLELFLSWKQDVAVSDERTRVARELHDTVKQKLFALGLQLATAKSKPAVMEAAREHILEAETITREAQQDLMEIITQLRLAVTSETSLSERIAVIAEDFRRRFGVNIEFSFLESLQFTASTEHHLQRLVQEALMNAIRHGHASQIAITCQSNQHLVSLKISDNGSGFDVDKKTGGFGITSMRDRVRDLPQGKFEIKSSAGKGTQITVSWKKEL